MAEAYFKGKAGVWRTVGGRRIFIVTGQSLRDAMRASGKFKNLDDDTADNRKKTNKMVDKDEAEAKEAYEKAKDNWSYVRNIYKRDSDEYNKAKEEYEKAKDRYTETGRTSGEYYASESAKSRAAEMPYMERNEMMNVVDKWSAKGFNEPGAYGNDGSGKGILHQRDASVQLEGWGGDADDFVIRGMDMGSVDQKVALKELNRELAKNGYEARYTKDPDQVVHQDIEIRKIKATGTNDSKAMKAGDKILVEDTYTGKYGSGYQIVREATYEDKAGKMNTSMKGYIVRDSLGNEILQSEIRIKKVSNMSVSELAQTYMDQGYSKETARAMAREDIQDRR